MKTLSSALEPGKRGLGVTFLSTCHRCRGIATIRLRLENRKALLFALLLFVPSHLFGQYSINWYKVAGGGGTSTGGIYTVSGTIGQHDAGGPLTGGNYSLTGGFWAIISVVQMPGAPPLLIIRSGNTVTVFWQNVSGWSLQQNSNLAVPAGWSASGGVTNTNGTNYLNLTAPAGNLFFRLAQP